jgi:hypothetical protein
MPAESGSSIHSLDLKAVLQRLVAYSIHVASSRQRSKLTMDVAIHGRVGSLDKLNASVSAATESRGPNKAMPG